MASGARGVSPGIALFPLRLFLGLTFVYAGVQKLSDPGFLHPGAPTYIGTQLHGFASGTPGGFLLRAFALPHPALAGIGVAVFEILIGLLVAFGLLTRIAALGGLGLNLVLFLTASWHTTPYFLGSDIVFVFAWLPFALAGAAGQPALDHALERPSPALARRTRLHPETAGGRVDAGSDAVLTRRALVAELGVAALAIAGISALVKGPYRGSSAGASSPTASTGGASGGPASSSQSSSTGSSSTTQASAPAGGVKIGPSGRLGDGQAALYRDPSDGSPDILIRQPDGRLIAFSAVCTHAGCTVSYQGGEIVCPCHGGAYDPQTGAVVSGPPPRPLARKQVVEQGGQIYAVPS